MSRSTFMEHKGRKILVLAINGCPSEEFEDFLAESAAIIRKEPPCSLLVMALGGTRMPIPTNKGMFVEYFTMNTPHIKASAVVGLPAIEKEMFSGIIGLASRDVKFFEDEEEAKDWLASVK